MSNRITILKKIWRYLKRHPLPAIELGVVTASVFVISFQLSENVKQNRVSIRGQLYETENSLEKEGREDDILNSIYTYEESSTESWVFYKKLLSTATKNEKALNDTTPDGLYETMFGPNTLADSIQRKETENLRRVFLYTQAVLYHIHNAFDYQKDGILTKAEWVTWQGSIREMSAHPVFLTVVWQGHKFSYFSKKFAKFLQEITLSPDPKELKTKADSLDYQRDVKFIKLFYPEMALQNWADPMPDY